MHKVFSPNQRHRRKGIAHMTHTTQVLASSIAQALVDVGITDAGIIAGAITQALGDVSLTPAPIAATPAQASTRVEAVKKDKLSVAADRKRAKKESAPAPVMIIGQVAEKGLSYKTVDKTANIVKQCVVKTCRHKRVGRSRFCKAHKTENFQSLRDKNGSIDD